jgi:hypothetical protein
MQGDKLFLHILLTAITFSCLMLPVSAQINGNREEPIILEEPEWTASGLASGQNNNLPMQITLYPNFPNPFNVQTVIRYALSINGYVELNIFDVNRQKVATLFNGKQSSGLHEVR